MHHAWLLARSAIDASLYGCTFCNHGIDRRTVQGGVTEERLDVSDTPNNEGSRRTGMDETGINFDAVMEQHELAAQAHRSSSSLVSRWLPILSGGLLMGIGLAKHSWGGTLVAAAGGGILYYDLARRRSSLSNSVPDGQHSIRVEKAITINKPIAEVYDAWCDVTKLPQILSHLVSVTGLGDGRSHWVAKAPFGRTVEWDAETLVDQENHVIAWRSIGDTEVPNIGAVHFHEAPDGRGTEVLVRIEYNPPRWGRSARYSPSCSAMPRASRPRMTCAASRRSWRPAKRRRSRGSRVGDRSPAA